MSHPLHERVPDEALVRALLRAQHPDLADLPLTPVAAGWDNALWRLGDRLAVRLPVRAAAAPLVAHEQRWLPVLAERLPVPVPAPVRTGLPGEGYPWRWSVVPWFDGRPADTLTAADRDPWAEGLAAALVALHVPAPPDAPANPYRGVPMAARAAAVTERLAGWTGPHADVLRRAWADGVAADPWSGPPVWLHGDPHPGNLLVRDGALAALLDLGDLTAGDPASDLATGWLTFDAAARGRFWRTWHAATALPLTAAARDALTRRARGWAAALVPVLGAHPDQHPGLAAVARHAASALAADPG